MSGGRGTSVLIAALSGRALAQSANRAGLAPIVLDAFGDLDMREAAAVWRTIPIDRSWRFDSLALLEAAARLAPPPVPLVWGSGLARCPDLLARLAAGRTLAGCPPAVARRLADPLAMAELCRSLGIPHPETRTDARSGGPGWLVKRRGGSGGSHIREAHGQPVGPGEYLQRAMPGKPVSALLLGSGAEVQVLGLSEQWPSPAPGSPFRFSGVAAPAALEPQVAGRLGEAAARLATAAGVLGLASADFLHDEASGQHWLLELNPRPGASLEAFEMLFETSLLPLHLEGCAGLRPGQLPSAPARRAAATQIVYAPDDLRVPANFAWPDWTGDRGPSGTELPKGAPACTVRAIAATTAAARAMVEGRSRRILAAIADEPIERWAAGQGVAIDTPSGSECTRNEGVR